MAGLSFTDIQDFQLREGLSWSRFALSALGWSFLTRAALAFSSATSYVLYCTLKRLRSITAGVVGSRAQLWKLRLKQYYHHLKANPSGSFRTVFIVIFGGAFVSEMLGRGKAVNDSGLSFLLGAVEFVVYPVFMFFDGWTFLGGWIAAKIAVVWRAGHSETTLHDRWMGRTEAGSKLLKAQWKDENRKFGNRFTIYLIATVCVLGVCYMRATTYFVAFHQTDEPMEHICLHIQGANGALSMPTLILDGFRSGEHELENTALDRVRTKIDSTLLVHGTQIRSAFIVGGSDREQLHGKAKARWGENNTLSRARGEYVKDLMCRSPLAPRGLRDRLVCLTTGAAQYGALVHSDRLARDRTVTIIFFVQEH